MKLSIIQLNISYKNPTDNIQRVSQLLSKADEVGGLVLLPELMTTGYLFNNRQEIHALCENFNNSETIRALAKLAEKYKTLLVAGIAEYAEGQYFNSVAVINSDGVLHNYRKISQNNIDRQYFPRGSELLTFQYQGLTFGLAICFDLWFAEIIREYVRRHVDVLLHPANFGGM